MREFYLINGNGIKYSLMDVGHWLYKPKNLGANFSNKYEQIDSDFVRTRRIAKPKDPKGKILFTGKNKYEDYYNFIMFLAVEPLTLLYKSNDLYRAKVDLKEIDKTEIEGGILECDITFKRCSRWYREVTILNDEPETGGKIYPYKYIYKYMEYEAQQATFDSDSGYDSKMKLTIFGPVENPIWKHYLNNELIATGKIFASVRTGRRIVIDGTKIPPSIREMDNSGKVIRDLYQYSDFDTQRFFNIKMGRNRITVEHDGSNSLGLAVEARLEYETV